MTFVEFIRLPVTVLFDPRLPRGLCFCGFEGYNRRLSISQFAVLSYRRNWPMNRFTAKKLPNRLLLMLLALSLSYCGQKGGLTRPEPAASAVASYQTSFLH